MESVEQNFTPARQLFEEIVSWLNSDLVCGLEHSQLENKLFLNGNELLRRLLQGYLDRRKDDQIEGDCWGSDGEKRTHKRQQSRKLSTIFGEVVVNRIGYGQRKITSLQPLDGELNLPPEKYSHGLSERVAEAVAFNGFEQTVEIIKKTTAAKIPKRQVEELARKSASDFEQFYQQQQTKINCPEKTGELMVITADGKGVVMRQEDLRPQTKKRAIESQKKHQKRLSKGEKRNSKRMATVGAVYTINRFRRTAEQIVNGEEKKSKSRKAPKPEGKRVWASLEKEPKTVITEIFEEAFSRDPGGEKNWVALVDGNKTQLQLIKNLAQKYQQSVTIVLDLIHVIEYVWKAAFVFHSPGTPEAENWVSEHLLEILKGKSSLVASRMRDDATLLKLKPEQRSGVDKCVNYLLNNQPYLRYDHYLAEGFPIATGVIEGACRHLIKDRMDITGARWSLKGAEAVLRLRSICVSGDWTDYWQFHIKQEHQRNHRRCYQSGIPLLKSLSQAYCLINFAPKQMTI
jgi:hypothetical protein